jgi:diguanylate cyclase (GGDEF)-like protein
MKEILTMKTATARQNYSPASRLPVHRFSAAPKVGPGAQVAMLQAEIERLHALLAAQAGTIESLANAANRCALTGALNRHGLNTGLAQALADYDRYGHRGAVILLDLNKFKPINDTYGHAVGDAMLVHVVNVLKANVRETDLVARLGGDEFVLVLKEATGAEATAKARQLAALLRATPLHTMGLELHISASLGVASFAEELDATELLKLADERMYMAKTAKNIGRA